MSVATTRSAGVVHLHPDDNVCVAVRNLQAGAAVTIGGAAVALSGAVGLGHKIAVTGIQEGQAVQIKTNGVPATGLPGPLFWEFDPANVESELPARRNFKVVWCCCDDDELENYCTSSASPV